MTGFTRCCIMAKAAAFCTAARSYPFRRHAFTVHGSLGSFSKIGLDTQEDRSRRDLAHLHRTGASIRYRPMLRSGAMDSCRSRELACSPGDYPAYYGAVRDAILGKRAEPGHGR